jgi:hypothetical protein
VLVVLRKRDTFQDFDGPRQYLHSDAQLVQSTQRALVKFCHRHGNQSEGAHQPPGRGDPKRVVDEVEIDGKRALAQADRRRGEAARRQVERRAPAMIDPGGQLQPDLADDLQPHVQCRVGLLPLCDGGQFRPGLGEGGVVVGHRAPWLARGTESPALILHMRAGACDEQCSAD